MFEDDNVEYVELDDNTKATLEVLTYKPKRNLFAIALWSDKIENVFIVPEGSIITPYN